MADIEIRQASTRREKLAFVKFPWKVYRGDPNWVPPLISDQLDYLDPARNNFYDHAQVTLLIAARRGEVLGTIAPFIDQQVVDRLGRGIGGFGFFEVVEDYPVAQRLLDAACAWLKARGTQKLIGPTNFTENDNPGVLIEGANCPPVMMEAHTPPYYKDFLERYGMQKDHDLYAWRAYREQIGAELKNLPPDIMRVAEAARKAAKVDIRRIRMEHWDEEIETAVSLFNATLTHLPDFVPIAQADFKRIADRIKPFVDPDLMLIAEVEGKAIGFCVAIPDINRVLIHLNGRLFPLNWLRVKRLIRQIDVVSIKLMGLLEIYRHRGIDAMLYLELVKKIYEKGYAWLDGSVTSEYNPAVNLIANRLGAERYKQYRIYQMDL